MFSKALMGGLVGLAASVASADIASFGFTDLNGSFNSDTMQFSAVAFTGGEGSTAGDVTRFAEGGGATANFDSGFAGGGSLANVEINIIVSNVAGGMADGNGTFVITDADGDQIRGDLAGMWFAGAMGFTFMNGITSDVIFTRADFGDGAFEGTSGGSFDTDSLAETYFGALSILLRTPDAAGFFDGDFNEVSTQADGLIVPTPASIALAGLGFGLAGTRRRR